MKNRYLVACDFDGTAFNTFLSSPNGMDVKEAYRQSLDDIFGQGIGEWFLANIGLNNKAPSQVITDLLSNADGHRERLMSNAWSFFEAQRGNLGDLIPECRDGTLSWNHDFPEITLTQMLVLKKLKHLMDEVGKQNGDGKVWPQPCEGFLNFAKIVSNFKKGGLPVDIAIISSGHESFIKKVFETWNIQQPDVLVTEDDIRQRTHPIEPEIRFKPGVFPLALAHHKWLKQQGLSGTALIGEVIPSKKRIMYIGDDPDKDIKMAQKGHVEGYLFPHTSWKQLAGALTNNKHLLDGRSLQEVLPHLRKGTEAFHVKGKERL